MHSTCILFADDENSILNQYEHQFLYALGTRRMYIVLSVV